MLKRILVISPHVDDVELAVGGSVKHWVDAGHEVYYAALSDCRDTLAGSEMATDTLTKECKAALAILGIPEDRILIENHTNMQYCNEAKAIFNTLEKMKERIKPDLVVIPTPTDTHQDHKTVAEQAISVFRRSTSILAYEQPWNTTEFVPNFFINLSDEEVDAKLSALEQYKSQKSFNRAYFAPEFLRAWVKTRGMHINASYAEAFAVIKWID